MVAVVSHDLKAPLSTIKMAVSYLTEELIPDVEGRRPLCDTRRSRDDRPEATSPPSTISC